MDENSRQQKLVSQNQNYNQPSQQQDHSKTSPSNKLTNPNYPSKKSSSPQTQEDNVVQQRIGARVSPKQSPKTMSQQVVRNDYNEQYFQDDQLEVDVDEIDVAPAATSTSGNMLMQERNQQKFLTMGDSRSVQHISKQNSQPTVLHSQNQSLKSIEMVVAQQQNLSTVQSHPITFNQRQGQFLNEDHQMQILQKSNQKINLQYQVPQLNMMALNANQNQQLIVDPKSQQIQRQQQKPLMLNNDSSSQILHFHPEQDSNRMNILSEIHSMREMIRDRNKEQEAAQILYQQQTSNAQQQQMDYQRDYSQSANSMINYDSNIHRQNQSHQQTHHLPSAQSQQQVYSQHQSINQQLQSQLGQNLSISSHQRLGQMVPGQNQLTNYQVPYYSSRASQNIQGELSARVRNRFQEQQRDSGQDQDGALEQVETGNDDSDNEYELCFVVEDVEFLTYNQGFIVHSQYFRDLLSNVNEQQIRILLPLWATASAFRIVLDFVNLGDIMPLDSEKDFVTNSSPSKSLSAYKNYPFDLDTIKNVLWLADFFQIHQLQRLCIDQHILPRLSTTNVLSFLDDAFQKLSTCQQQQAKFQAEMQDSQVLAESAKFEEQFQQYLFAEDIWYDFFNQCLEVCALSLSEIIKSQEKDLIALPASVVQEIIERSLKIQRRTEDNDLVKFMMKLRKLKSPFDLIEAEKQQVISNYEKMLTNKSSNDPLLTANQHKNQIKPLLTWKLSSLNMKQNFYKESDPFFVDGQSWILYIAKMNDKEFQVGIKFQSMFEQNYDSYDRINNSLKNVYSKYSLLSMLNWVRIETEPSLIAQSSSLLNVQHLIVSLSKSQCLLRTIPLHLLIDQQRNMHSASVNVEVYFQIKHTISAMLTYISLNFGMLNRDPRIFKLEAREFQLLLTHRKINVKSEDEVIEAISLWLRGQGNRIQLQEKEIVDLFKQVNWPYVSFDKLMEIFKNFPMLRQNIHLKSIFANEFRSRATKKQNEMSAPPRMSYDSVMIETMFDYKYFLDKVIDFTFKMFDNNQSHLQQFPHHQVQQQVGLSPGKPHYQMKQIYSPSQKQSAHLSSQTPVPVISQGRQQQSTIKTYQGDKQRMMTAPSHQNYQEDNGRAQNVSQNQHRPISTPISGIGEGQNQSYYAMSQAQAQNSFHSQGNSRQQTSSYELNKDLRNESRHIQGRPESGSQKIPFVKHQTQVVLNNQLQQHPNQLEEQYFEKLRELEELKIQLDQSQGLKMSRHATQTLAYPEKDIMERTSNQHSGSKNQMSRTQGIRKNVDTYTIEEQKRQINTQNQQTLYQKLNTSIPANNNSPQKPTKQSQGASRQSAAKSKTSSIQNHDYHGHSSNQVQAAIKNSRVEEVHQNIDEIEKNKRRQQNFENQQQVKKKNAAKQNAQSSQIGVNQQI